MHKHTVTTANGTVLKRNSKNRIYAYVAVETREHEGKITEKAVIWSGSLEGARRAVSSQSQFRAKHFTGAYTYEIMVPTVVSKIDPVKFMQDHFQVIHVG